MSVEFRKITRPSKVLNPLNEFREDTINIETRFDPLTDERCDLLEFRFALPREADVTPIISKSPEARCPFCPANVRTVTPTFQPGLFPEGRLQRGQAWLIPNLAPWAEHNPLVVLSEQHYVPIVDLTPRMLADAFLLAQTYYCRIQEIEHKPGYWSVGWNYMPPSGGSQIHPHLQVIGQTLPSPLEEKVILASATYHRQNVSIFWQDLVEKERILGERYLGDIGRTSWLMNYVSRSWLFEVLTIFNERPTLEDISEDDWIAFGNGLQKVLRYMYTKGLYSFNLCLYSGNRDTKNHLYTYSRLVPRFLYSPVQAADASLGRILHDWCFIFWKPEEVCTELKPYFD